MKPNYWVGLDMGTSSTKAVAFTPMGEVLATEQQDYPLQQVMKGAAVQNPEDIIQAAEQTLAAVCKMFDAPPQGIGLVSVMHSLLIVDRAGKPRSPLYTWADLRPMTVAKTLRESETGKDLFEQTGVPIHAMSPLCKIMWLRETGQLPNEEGLRFVGIKDYLLYRWFERWLIDESTASATGFLHLAKREWYGPALKLVGISENNLPHLVSPLHCLSVGDSPFLSSLHLPKGLSVAIGGADGCLANLGTGVLQPGTVTLTIGTSGAIRMTSNQAKIDAKMRLFTYYLAEDKYVMGGASNNGGKAWEWFCQSFYPDVSFAEALKKAAAIAPGADGLRAIPYVFGERAPHWDASLQASFSRVTYAHTRDHFARALLEGILFNLQLSLEALIEHYGRPDRIVANGGFTNSDFWVQMLADISGLPVDIADSPHATAYGAALLARRATGDLANLSMVKGMPMSRRFEPDGERQADYQRVFREWRE